MSILLLLTRFVLAAVFAFAATAKLADWTGTRQAVTAFGGAEKWARKIAIMVISIELGVAVLLVFASSARYGGIVAAAMAFAMIAVVAIALARGKRPECHCFGRIYSRRIGWSTLVRLSVLCLLAVGVALGATFTNPIGILDLWSRLNPMRRMAVAFVTAFCFALGAACWMLMELFRHHGRLLVRLEAIESKLDLAKQDHSQASVGEPAHPFVLPTPTGTKVGLTDLIALGRRVLLIFVDPNCPACETLQPYLARWERELSGRLTVALIVRGTAQANHHKVDNIRWVLLEGESEVWRAYACERTPSAVVVGTDARIGSPVMKGPQPIIAFLENAMPAVPNQTQPGDISLRQLVPALRLIDTGGRSAGLDEIAGKPTLLVFWNPACPYCRTLAELLRGNQEVPEIDTPRLIIISLARETADLRCPVFVDPDGYLMRSLGARSTPAAVLLDAETKLLSVVAIGAENVIQLIGSVSSAMSSS